MISVLTVLFVVIVWFEIKYPLHFIAMHGQKINESIFSQIKGLGIVAAIISIGGLIIFFTGVYSGYLIEKKEHLMQYEKEKIVHKRVSSLNHDLKNCLTGLKLGSHYLYKTKKISNSESEDFAKVIRNMEVSIDRIEEICDNLLTFYSLPQAVFKSVDINRIIKESLSYFRVDHPEIEVTEKLGEKILSVSLDADQIKRMLENIFLNAFQSMPKGGRLIVSSNKCSNKFIEIKITDTGSGIPKENLKDIFIPFFTTKSKAFGLGLSVAEEIVKKHRGSISVESKLKKGTNFVIKLPIKPT